MAHVRGERHPQAKLTEAQVRAIRESRAPIKEIAFDFKIARQHVRKIRTKELWAHV